LLEGALAARSDVGEDVGEALGGHCGLIVGRCVGGMSVCVVRTARLAGCEEVYDHSRVLS
jgi:hypothetical protein